MRASELERGRAEWPALRVIIAGGGTGGHLYPGIALAEELRRRNPGSQVMLVGAGGKLEEEILAETGLLFEHLPVAGWVGMPKARAARRLPGAVVRALGLLRRFRPHAVVALGGYAAGPLGLAAWLARFPLIVQEQNLVPGLTNRFLGKLAARVAASFEGSRAYFPRGKVVVTGNPLRRSFLTCQGKEREGEEGRGKTLFLFGGSQGSRALNDAMVEALPDLQRSGMPLRFIHQTGAQDQVKVLGAYQALHLGAEVRPYFDDMPERYRQADLVICRAGATSLAELAAAARPAVLVPYPYAAGGHQEWNARFFEREGAACVVLQKDLTGDGLARLVQSLLRDEQALAVMAAAAARLARPGAAASVVDLIYQVTRP